MVCPETDLRRAPRQAPRRAAWNMRAVLEVRSDHDQGPQVAPQFPATISSPLEASAPDHTNKGGIPGVEDRVVVDPSTPTPLLTPAFVPSPQRSLHQPHALSFPPFLTIAFQ